MRLRVGYQKDGLHLEPGRNSGLSNTDQYINCLDFLYSNRRGGHELWLMSSLQARALVTCQLSEIISLF